MPWSLAADTAFLFEEAFQLSEENPELVAALRSRLMVLRDDCRCVVGISPSSLVLSQSTKRGVDYLGRLCALVQDLCDTELRPGFLMVPNATRAGATGSRNNDLQAITELRERFDSALPPEARERCVWVDFDLNTASIRSLMSSCDVLLTSRFHAMIAGLCLAIPTVVIGWSHKYEEVLAEFRLDRFAFSFDSENLDLAEVVREVLHRQETLRAGIRAELPRVKSLAASQFAFLEGLVS